MKRKPVKRRVRTIPRRATRRKARQLPHIMKHFTFIVICTSIFLFIASITFHNFNLMLDVIILLAFCIVVDWLAIALQ